MSCFFSHNTQQVGRLPARCSLLSVTPVRVKRQPPRARSAVDLVDGEAEIPSERRATPDFVSPQLLLLPLLMLLLLLLLLPLLMLLLLMLLLLMLLLMLLLRRWGAKLVGAE